MTSVRTGLIAAPSPGAIARLGASSARNRPQILDGLRDTATSLQARSLPILSAQVTHDLWRRSRAQRKFTDAL